jgi:hypothetical protein
MDCERCSAPGGELVLHLEYDDGEIVEIWVCSKCIAICVMAWFGCENNRSDEEIWGMVNDLQSLPDTWTEKEGSSTDHLRSKCEPEARVLDAGTRSPLGRPATVPTCHPSCMGADNVRPRNYVWGS